MPKKKKTKATEPTVTEGPPEKRLVQHLGAAAQLASDPLESDIQDYISTQCATLDYICGRPGIPTGRLTTIIGREGSGKSLLAYNIIAETQRRGGLAVLIDAERRYMKDHGERLGIDHNRLVVLKNQTLEDVFGTIEKTVDWLAVENPPVACIILDSLSGSIPKKMLEDDVGGVRPGAVARLVSQEMPRLHEKLAGNRIAFVLINQLRQHVSIDTPWMGDQRSEGRRKVMKNNAMLAEGALIFWSSLILYMASTGTIGGDEPTGITVKAQVRKTSIGPTEGWKASFDIGFLDGVDKLGSKLDLLDRLVVVSLNSSWYALGDQKFQRRNWGAIYEEHQEMIDEIVTSAPTAWMRSEK